MKKGPILLLGLGIVVLVAAAALYTRRPTTPTVAPSAGGSGPAAQRPSPPAGQQRTLAYFGITGGPSQTEPRGLLVSGFIAPAERSPLKVMGVQEGDVILTCNGEARQMGDRLNAAIQALQQRGEKITLVVLRNGKQVTLERTEKLPPNAVPQG